VKALPTLVLPLLLLPGCLAGAEPADLAVASYPAAFAAETLAGDDLRVADLAPGGELHDFEPSSRDLDQLRKSTHLVLWDERLEAWAHRAEASLGGSAPQVVEIGRLPPGETYLQGEDGKGGSGEGDDGRGHDEARDPHTWTDPLAMQASVAALEAYLAEAYPEHAADVHARAAAVTDRLAELDRAFRSALSACTHSTIVTNHEAHAYLARRYGIELVNLHGLEPGSEPSPGTVESVIRTLKDLGLPALFIEEGTDPDALRAIQDETGVQVRVLHTLEARPASGDYVDAQYQNIQELRFALACA